MAEKPNESTIVKLLEDLHSAETYNRNDAIKTIIKNKISDERVIAALLQSISSDPSLAVRNFARSALDTFGVKHSEFEKDEPVVIPERQSTIDTSNEPVLDEGPMTFEEWLTKNQQQIWGFFGWYVIASVLAPFSLGVITTPVTVFFLLAFGISKERKGLAGGILVAVALNFFLALARGLQMNAWCFMPFYIDLYW